MTPRELVQPAHVEQLARRAIRLRRVESDVDTGRHDVANHLGELADGEILPGPDKQSDEELAAHARRFVKTVYHPCGTARMGADDGAVVRPDLRLRGIDGLRVVDASVMPAIISGNTNATVLVVAEKAAEYMLGRAPRPAAAREQARAYPRPAE